MPGGSGRVGALDGVRGLAVVAVVAFHAFPGIVPGGFFGVEAFFVLSGFLLTRLLLAEHDRTGGIDVVAFARRRLRRIVPALWLLLAALVLVALVAARSDASRLPAELAASAVGLTNWHLVAERGSYFAQLGRPPPVRHLWSVAVEVQFYLVCPLLGPLGGPPPKVGGRRRPGRRHRRLGRPDGGAGRDRRPLPGVLRDGHPGRRPAQRGPAGPGLRPGDRQGRVRAGGRPPGGGTTTTAPPAPPPTRRRAAPTSAATTATPARAAPVRAAPTAPRPPASLAPGPAPGTVSVSAVGDSVMLSAAGPLKARLGPSGVIDAKVARQFREGVAVVDTLRQQGRLAPVVVVHLGTNGPPTPGDVDAMIAAAGPSRLLLLTVRVNRSWSGATNAVLAAAPARHPTATLVDWAGHSDGHGDWFHSDGTHLTAAGAGAYAALIGSMLPQPAPVPAPPAPPGAATTTAAASR